MTAYVKNASVAPHLIDSRDPPAIALLKEDHQIFRALFDIVETISEDILLPIAEEICIRLAIHMHIEEEFLYPSLKCVLDCDEMDDAIVDHQRVRRLISSIMDMKGSEGPFRSRIHDLGEEVIRHADNEDREFLREARLAWDAGKVDLVQIGVQMQSHRRDLLRLIGSSQADTCAFDVDLPAEAVRCVAQPSAAGGNAWPEPAGSGHGRR